MKICSYFTLLIFHCSLFIACEPAPRLAKTTELYAVKGADSLYLDRYTLADRSDDEGKRPCLVFVFGGGFISGTRDAEAYLSFFEHMASEGYDVVSIDYRLGLKQVVAAGDFSPAAMMTGMVGTVEMAVEDLFDATSHVVAKAEEWGIDPAAIVAVGSSAGAITVLHGEYALCTESPLVAHLPGEFRYAGIVSLAGAIFSPAHDLVWTTAPAPMLLFHGDADANVPYDVVREGDVAGFFGSKYIAGQLRGMGAPHYFYSFENANHRIATAPMDENRDVIRLFLTKLVTVGEPLMIDTRSTTLGTPDLPKDFSLEDYVSSNFQ